ncbi:DUF3275 family protein [Suttonella indologenes]|uniref:Protein of uncharacterized function (DUF3275) n=1 Tax=Suttonella indologenes TaxID=13276 RepID=A0A380MLP4_9GAMM|nr:DUF3275 family protein [Suttonella indologenes]SUO90246.1 Protein of uncharacterised function (DUF3275) [Suttonella indologenes]
MENFDPVTLQGRLKVAYLNGRFGQFPVGTLETAIGTFTVRDSKEDAWLENLSAGEYTGQFEISELSLYTYRAFGEARTCIRAEISAYQLDDFDDEVEEVAHYPDPIEEEGEVPDSFSRDSGDEEDSEDAYDEQVSLLLSFLESGSNWSVGDDYRIDTTIGRSNIVECRKALLGLGYVFDPLTQIWHLQGERS